MKREPRQRSEIHHSTGRYQRLAARLPTLVWPCWSLPLRRSGLGHRELRSALSVLIALAGAQTPLDELIEALGGATTRRRVSRVAGILQTSARWEATRSAIALWAAYLDTSPPPIDYQRRRGLACDDLLPTEVWQTLSLSVGVDVGQGIRLALLRCWLFERLTTLPAERSPWAIDSADFRTKLGALPLWITAELVIALDEYGRRFLADRNIHREPLVWAPPDAGRHLAVVPEEAVDISAIHEWIGEHQPRSFAGLLQKFDLDIDTARYLLEEFPAPNASMNA